MSHALDFDLDAFPLIVATLRGPQGEAEAIAYCQAIEQVLERGTPYAVLHRFEAFGPNLVAGGLIARWSLKHTKALRERCLGGAVVVQSHAFRFILSSFQLVTPLPAPVAKSEAEAVAWLEARFREKGIPFDGLGHVRTSSAPEG